MTALEYLSTLNLKLIQPSTEQSAVNIIIYSHQKQRRIIRIQQDKLSKIPKWIRKIFCD